MNINDIQEIMNKDSINEENDKDNFLNNNSNYQEMRYTQNSYQYISREKIVHLKRASKVCCQNCTILWVSFVISLVSLLVGLVGFKSIWCLIVTLPFGLVFVGEIFFFIICSGGFRVVQPNNALMFEYYGRYIGTLKDNGYWYGFPFATVKTVSLKRNQYNGIRIKATEREGNPVEIGTVVIWKIGDTAKVIFDVDDYCSFIEGQSQGAIKYIASKYPYDPVKPGEISLRGSHEIIEKLFKEEVELRFKDTGIILEDVRVTAATYGEEVINTMLKKQASTVDASAKETIVKSATGSIIQSLNEFEKYGCRFKDEEKVKFVISMMNTLCGSENSKIILNP